MFLKVRKHEVANEYRCMLMSKLENSSIHSIQRPVQCFPSLDPRLDRGGEVGAAPSRQTVDTMACLL